MTFLHFFILGITIPIMSLYYKQYLGFSGTQAGFILSMGAVAAFTGPLIGSFVADRLLSAERLFALAHLAGGLLLFAVYFSSGYWEVFFLSLLYMLFIGPCTSLATAITFHHLPDGQQSYGGIRVWGTLGWIGVGWLFSLFWLRDASGVALPERLPHALLVSGLGSLFLSFFVFFFIHQTGSKKMRRARLLPTSSLQVIRQPEIVLLAISFFLVSFADKFYFFGAAPFLSEQGISTAMILPLLSVGQIPEIFAMFFLGRLIKRFGFFRVIISGVFLEIIRFLILAAMVPSGLLLFGISLHGLVYTFVFAASFIFLDSYCSPESRAGVHQFFAMVNAGAGSLLGNALAGILHDHFTTAGVVSWSSFWLIPAGVSVIAFVLFLVNPGIRKKGV